MSAKQPISAPTLAGDSANLSGPLPHDENYNAHRHKTADAHRQNRAPNSTGDSVRESRDSAEYIAVLASQLQRIAETNGHEFLAYLIEMAVMEAWRIAGPDADLPDQSIKGSAT